MYETDQSGHGVEINPLAPDLYIAEQRIIELEAERDKLREALESVSRLEPYDGNRHEYHTAGKVARKALAALLQDKEKADE